MTNFTCVILPRLLFIFVSIIGVWRVVKVKEDGLYWFLTILYLPLLVEMNFTRKGKCMDCKWFSPAIFFFLISIIPSLWLLELHHQQNKASDSRCDKLDSSENIKRIINMWRNSTNGNETFKGSVSLLSSLCANDWILALHQILLILLILGKWILPAEGRLTRDQLSQLLLVFVGTAADILEFTSETLSDVKHSSPSVVYIVLGVWTWSMLQFPLHLSVLNAPDSLPEGQGGTLVSRLSSNIWSIMESLFIQDGPFLVVRLTVMIYFEVVHQMLIFFAIKNLLVVTLNVYRLYVIICDHKSS